MTTEYYIENTFEDIRACLAFACEMSGRTQAEIAVNSGICESTLSLILTGKRRPRLEQVIRLAVELEQPLEYIIFPDLDHRNQETKLAKN